MLECQTTGDGYVSKYKSLLYQSLQRVDGSRCSGDADELLGAHCIGSEEGKGVEPLRLLVSKLMVSVAPDRCVVWFFIEFRREVAAKMAVS